MARLSQSLKAEPNLTPILDMVFQLITFFVLVVNFKAATLDLSLDLPVIGSAVPSETADRDVFVLNIDKEGKLRAYGQVQDIEKCITEEARSAVKNAQAKSPDFHAGEDLPVTVILRADRKTPYHLLNRIITTCQANGFRNFQFRALNARPET
jgi:biopolymer transport protein ExbD